MPVGVSLERLDRHAGAQVDPASRCILAAISPITPPSGPTSASARSATVTGRPSSQHTEAISEPIKPEPTINTRPGRAFNAACSRAASSQVRNVNTPSRAPLPR